MATIEDMATVRRLAAEPDDTGGYTIEVLTSIIDAEETLEAAAARIWREKAASVSGLVDISEGSSRRSLSQVQQQYLAMAEAVNPSAVVQAGRRTSTSRPIERV